MKVRTGFVSNSSSSSFILGWGVTADGQFEELKNFLSKNKIEYDGIIDYAQKSYEDVKLFMRHLDNGERILYGGNDTELIIPRKIAEDYWYNDYERALLVVDILNDEGDERFRYVDGEDEFGACYDLNYDIAKKVSFYKEKQQKLIEILQDKRFFKDSNVIFGAERNG